MKINNKFKRSLTSERWWKASKEAERLWDWSRKWEVFFQEKWVDNHRRKKRNEKREILEVWQKIKNWRYVFPEIIDWEKPHWTLRRETDKIEWFEIKEVIINKLWKPKYICVGSDWKNYAIKQFHQRDNLKIYEDNN